MDPTSSELVLDIVVDHVEKHYASPAPRVFSRQERLARLLALLKQVFGRPSRSGIAADECPPQQALVDISLKVGQGAVLGICGEKGSGKTTLLRILAGLERPTSGRVALSGRVAGVFALGEGPCHRQLSVRENVLLTATRLELGRDWVRHNLAAIAQYAQLDVALKTPLGMVPKEAYWRFAWALALRSSPKILLIDELPLTADPLLADDVRREIASRRTAGLTVVLSGNQPAQVALLCSHLAYLQQGRIGDCGPASEPPPPPPAAPSQQPDGPLLWYWMSMPLQGWATYVRLDPSHVQRKQAQGYELTLATPPWVDAEGVCSLEPWQPAARAARRDIGTTRRGGNPGAGVRLKGSSSGAICPAPS